MAIGMGRAWLAFRYWMTLYRRNWRGTIVISIANPMLFLLGIGVGLGHLVNHGHPADLGGVSYTDFFAPGLLAAAAMQTGFVEGGGRVRMAATATGAYQEAVTTPLEPDQIMVGHFMFITFRLITSSAAFIAVMLVFGVTDGWRGLATWPAAWLTGLAFAIPIAAWAVTQRSMAKLQGVFRFVLMPLYMFSGTFFALSELPHGVQLVAEAFPLAQGVELCRSISLGTASAASIASHAAYLLAFVLVGLTLARVTYRRRLHA
jgi:ABC-type polysaccharide/polyol phosphate export permease